jgi:hypothetical protein
MAEENLSLVILCGGVVTIHNFKDLSLYFTVPLTNVNVFCCSDSNICYGKL